VFTIKEIKQYQCTFCNTLYKDKEKAKLCEENHSKPVSVIAKKYLSYNQDKTGYPFLISVKFETGEEVAYERKRQ